jgi:hypothetical protein
MARVFITRDVMVRGMKKETPIENHLVEQHYAHPTR